MPYRNQPRTPDDPETQRPKLSFWRRRRVSFDCFLNLCSEQWVREWCGGVWLKGEELYNLATHSNTNDTKALFFWSERSSIGSHNRFTMCEWIPLIQVEDNPSCFYMFYQPDDHSKQQLMIIVDVLSKKLLMKFFNPKLNRWIKIGSLDKWLNDRLEVYQHSLKIDESIRFEPSAEALLDTWPDYWHMRQLGIIKS